MNDTSRVNNINFKDKLYLNSCPRDGCNGAVRLTHDMWGYFLYCLICGWHCECYPNKSLAEIIVEDKEQHQRQYSDKEHVKVLIKVLNVELD